VRSEKATTQDVTEEYSDTQTQISSLEVQHAQLLELMKHTGSVDELLKVQQQADQVRLQIDRLKGHATALERLSSLASITVTAQAAGVVLEREYVGTLSAVRQAETQQAGLVAQLKRARTPEEEAKLRDSLGQVELQLQRAHQQLDSIGQTAGRLGVGLPQPADAQVAVVGDDTLASQYIQTRVALRQAEADQQRITADLQAGAGGVTPEQLQAAILHTSELSLQLKTLQDRAGQVGITLPVITSDEEAAMARVVGPAAGAEALATLRRAWNLSLSALLSVGSTVVLLWWVLLPLGAAGVLLVRRRRRA
jgi:hypothetical protein